MSSLPAPRVSTKPTPKPAALLAIWIPDYHGNRFAYEVTLLRPNPAMGIPKAYRLQKADNGTAYDCAVTAHGVTCDCADFLYRRDGNDSLGCKHVQALRSFGMLPAVLESEPCGCCLGDGLSPADANETDPCVQCGGIGVVPLTAAELDELANDPFRPESPRMTDEEIDRMAELLHITDDLEEGAFEAAENLEASMEASRL